MMNTSKVLLLLYTFQCCLQAASADTHEGAQAHKGATVLRHGRSAPSLLQTSSGNSIEPQPQPEGHFLTNTELRSVESIPCLEAKQQQAGVICNEGSVAVEPSLGFVGRISMSNYPTYTDSICNSNGEYFCDPMSTLNVTEQAEIALLLKQLRYDSHVTCGAIQSDPANEYNLRPFRTTDYHYQPFYLGVAIAEGWDASDIDNDSLKVFGQSLAAQWNMDERFIGSPRPYAMCPNLAMMIVVPDRRQVYLSTQSCEFICQDRGGLEVTKISLGRLDSEGTAAAVKAGVRKVYELLTKNEPLHGPLDVANPSSSSSNTEESSSSNGNMNSAAVTTQRVVYVLSIFAVIVSGFVALGVFLLAPGLIKSLDKR